MVEKRQFIGAQEFDDDGIKEIRAAGGFIHLDQVTISAADGTTYLFYGLMSMLREPEHAKRDIAVSVAIGPQGTLQVLEHESKVWYSGGPLEYDQERGELRHTAASSRWTIARIFSPSYWQDVTAFDYSAWQDENTSQRYFD